MNPHFESDAERWRAVQTRDPAADGSFVFAVRTTGVYCRPHCRSRLPLRANVEFHAGAAQAESAGFRACKRCAPDRRHQPQPALDAVRAACRRIETSQEPVRLEELAAAAGLSRYHFHRVFRKHVGVTPTQYAAAQRLQRYREGLASNRSVTEALFDAGFGSASRAYESADCGLGMTATTYRAGGAGERIAFALTASSLGSVGVAATERGVCAIEFAVDGAGFESALRRRFPNARLTEDAIGLRAMLAAIVDRIERGDESVALPLDIRGTAFQLRVWQELRRIPLGSTTSYGEIATAIGAPRAVRAVASACAANPAALAIPCHRVLRRDGGEGGYRWGIGRKRALLLKERVRRT
jgi:AraC family transcriptional regulator of adaptative response/methylated-DNA-[protein]-cysteine methyltransferase